MTDHAPSPPLDTRRDRGERPHGLSATCFFEARALEVRYARTTSAALSGVDLAVPHGAFYAVIGPNGSGKSTLMRAFLGAAPVTRGEALVEGRPAASWSRRDLARTVGAVSQNEGVSFPITVRELVAMGRYPHLGPLSSEGSEDREAISLALERCDATQLAARHVGTLSGGEFQRVRLARALAQRPRALALDEPTASLDIRHEMTILGLLRDAATSGTTVLLITHHLDQAARFADRMLLLDRGEVAAEGTPERVMTEDTLSRVYGWPLGVDPDPFSGKPRVTARGLSSQAPPALPPEPPGS